MSVMELKAAIERLYDLPAEDLPDDAEKRFLEFRDKLSRGEVRAAEPGPHGWVVNSWVKKGILLGFRIGRIEDFSMSQPRMRFFDKHTFPPRIVEPEDQIRIVPGGSSIREGAFLGRGVVCMPPMYVNVGARVGSATMIDSHALVGSCAQVGERVHVSAAAQLGGVLEPVNASPVVVEDDAVIGGNVGVYEGTIVRRGAVLGAGVVLTRGTPVFDLVHERVYRAEGDAPLEIPENAVVVGGARRVGSGWGEQLGLSLYTPVIVKYRDQKTDLATALEGWLR